MRLVGAEEPLDEFFTKLDQRWKAYRKSSIEQMVEASEKGAMDASPAA